MGWTMKFGTKITTLLAAAIVILLSSSLAYAEESITIEAQSAMEFAKSVGFDTSTITALETAESGTKSSIIQCGATLCNLGTHFCYKETVSWSAGYGDSLSECFCKEGKPPIDNRDGFYNNGATGGFSTKVRRHIITTNCAESQGSRGRVFEEHIEAQDSMGKRYRIFAGKDSTIQYAEENFDGCEVLPVKLYKHKKCFFCPIVGVIYDGAASITDFAFDMMAPAFAVLLAVGFGLWIVVLCLSHVSTLTKQDAPKFLGSILKQSYKVVIVFVLLQAPNNIFDYMVRPVVNAGLTFGKSMLSTDTNKVFAGLDYEDGRYVRQAVGKPGGKYYNVGTYDNLEQYIVAVQRELAFMQATGTSLMCVGSDLMMTLKSWSKNIGDGFLMLIQGALLAIFGFLISIAFVFYLLDGIIQLGVAGALLPLLLVAWPFKPISKWTKVGVGMILNTAFLFMFVGLVVSSCVHLIDATLSKSPTESAYQELLDCKNLASYREQNKERCEELQNETHFGGLYLIAKALNEQNIKNLKDFTDITGENFLILLFAAIFGFKFVGQAPALANKFASGGISKQIAPSFATIIASSAKSAALAATKDLRESANERFEHGVKKVAATPGRIVSKAYNRVRGKNNDSSDNDDVLSRHNVTPANATKKPENEGAGNNEKNNSNQQNREASSEAKNNKAKKKPQSKQKRKVSGGSGKNRKKLNRKQRTR